MFIPKRRMKRKATRKRQKTEALRCESQKLKNVGRYPLKIHGHFKVRRIQRISFSYFEAQNAQSSYNKISVLRSSVLLDALNHHTHRVYIRSISDNTQNLPHTCVCDDEAGTFAVAFNVHDDVSLYRF